MNNTKETKMTTQSKQVTCEEANQPKHRTADTWGNGRNQTEIHKTTDL